MTGTVLSCEFLLRDSAGYGKSTSIVCMGRDGRDAAQEGNGLAANKTDDQLVPGTKEDQD